MSIKIFLVEDHDIVREGLRLLLAGEPDLKIIGEASHGGEALERIKYHLPDVVIMDLSMPVLNGIQCTRQLKRLYPALKVLVLSMHDEESYLTDVLNSGAEGYVIKNAGRPELVFAIKKIAAGGKYISPEFTVNMLNKYNNSGGFSAPVRTDIRITPRENEVLNLIVEGLTNLQMSHKLFTSVRTIETRRKNLLDKTGTTNTATLVCFAIKHGLVK